MTPRTWLTWLLLAAMLAGACDTTRASLSDQDDLRRLADGAGGLIAAEKYEEALVVYDEAIDTYGEMTSGADLDPLLAPIWLDKAYTLEVLGRVDEARQTYVSLIGRYGSSEAPRARQQVAKAMVNLGVTYSLASVHETALSYYDRAIDEFGDSRDDWLDEPLAQAHLNRGLALAELGRIEEAVAELELFLDGMETGWDVPSLTESVEQVRAYLDELNSESQ